MATRTRHSALLGPAPVAVHDDADVIRKIARFDESHGNAEGGNTADLPSQREFSERSEAGRSSLLAA
jgi:hypothetical protein